MCVRICLLGGYRCGPGGQGVVAAVRCICGLALMMLLVACSTTPVVYAPGDMAGGRPSGTVPPLKALIPQDGSLVRLVFIHGVGDTCAGYALNPKTGWLNDATAESIGLQPVAKEDQLNIKRVYANVFMDESLRDPRSYVEYAVRRYKLRLGGGANRAVPVEAIEITWSHLTQWIKTNQLSYDSPSVFRGRPHCMASPDPKIVPPILNPPERVAINRTIKESVLDRDMADAIVYIGTYGPVIQRGVADALCHAITGQSVDRKCIWPNREELRSDNSHYVFVTHSLGSRILYDTLLGLTGFYLNKTTQPQKANPFEKELANTKPFALHILASTSAVYMMANQISYLGLAYIPEDAVSGAGPVPMLALGQASGQQAAQQHARNLIEVFGRAVADARATFNRPSKPLRIIAFNDTNDLLTWHMPRWYSSDRVALSNVFVQNAPHWIVFEDPIAAHDDYFNSDVWKVISCGEHGKRLQCH